MVCKIRDNVLTDGSINILCNNLQIMGFECNRESAKVLSFAD